MGGQMAGMLVKVKEKRGSRKRYHVTMSRSSAISPGSFCRPSAATKSTLLPIRPRFNRRKSAMFARRDSGALWSPSGETFDGEARMGRDDSEHVDFHGFMEGVRRRNPNQP